MSVKIIIERKFKVAPDPEILRKINELRIYAMRQKGYITGETLINTVDNREVVVLSVWSNLEDWTAWSNSRKRRQLEELLAENLAAPEKISCFTPGPEYLKKAFAQFMHDSDTGT